MTSGNYVHDLMALIYQDIDEASLIFGHRVSRRADTRLRDAGVLEPIERVCELLEMHKTIPSTRRHILIARTPFLGTDSTHRYRNISRISFTLLSIVSFSQTLRTKARILNDADWALLINSLDDNAASIEHFARVRGLDYLAALAKVAPLWNFLCPNGSPKLRGELSRHRSTPLPTKRIHDYVVPDNEGAEPTMPMFENADGVMVARIDVDRFYYDAQQWAIYRRPRRWPREWPYPHNPTTRRRGNVCRGCGASTDERCDCDPNTIPQVLRPLVEIANYGAKGIGVRALQYIPAGSVLAPYYGQVVPTGSQADSMYMLSMDLGTTGANIAADYLAVIDAKERGNWTRYINHSCDASTGFESANYGDKKYNVLVTNRPIGIFEEITVDYGRDYWRERHCQCGAEHCIHKGRSRTPTPQAEEEEEEEEEEVEEEEGDRGVEQVSDSEVSDVTESSGWQGDDEDSDEAAQPARKRRRLR
ncbi:hypothetical protein MMC25_004921 [Agyrium rufum]|nr:hypothetical protein [Agyrium rufum]